MEEISQDIAILVFENDNDSPKDSLRYFNDKQTSIDYKSINVILLIILIQM